MQIPILALYLLRLCVESQASALLTSFQGYLLQRKFENHCSPPPIVSSCLLSQFLAEEVHLRQDTLNLTTKKNTCVNELKVGGFHNVYVYQIIML